MASSRLIPKKKAQVKTSRQQKDKLGSPVLPKFGVVEPNCCKHKTVVPRPKVILQNSELSGQLLYMLFHVFTLCTSTYFASTSHVVEHVAQVKNLQHIQQATSRLLLLYFTSQKGDMQLHRQDLFEKGTSESITSANNKLGGPLPPKNRSC